ncbi:MAG: hypothetical protein AAF487_13040 [Bacteroidota bacterium]
MNIRYLNILIFLFASVLVNAQQNYLECEIDTNSILVGEQTDLHISLFYANEKDKIEWPVLQDTLIDKVEIINSSETDTSKFENQFVQRLHLTITSFDSGYYAIRPFNVKINDLIVSSEALLLEVRNVPLDSLNLSEVQLTDLNDIKDIYDDPFTFSEFLNVYGIRIVSGLGGLGFMTFLAWFFFMRKPHEIKEQIIQEKALPDFEIALSRLAQIEKEEIWQNGNTKRYHTEVTETVRNYLESRFNIQAMEQTSGEIIQQMQFADINQGAREQLIRMLRLADMVKFAKEKPQAAQNIASMNMALEFIELTKRKEDSESKA